MSLKNSLISKLASFTRKRHLFFLDQFLRLMYSPDKRCNDFIEKIITSNEGLFFSVNTSSYIEWQIFFYGVYEPLIINLFNMFLTKGDVAIDVGSNMGFHALNMAAFVGESGKIYAFEPHPQLLKKLKENIVLNKTHWIEVFDIALSDFSGVGKLSSFKTTDANQGSSSLVRKIGGRVFDVKLKTLDEWATSIKLSSLKLIKIDVEGHDLAVLKGGENTIKKFKPIVIFELNKDFLSSKKDDIVNYDFYEFFNSLSYKLSLITKNGLIPFSGNIPNGNMNIVAVP